MTAGPGRPGGARAQWSWSGFLRSVMVKVMSGMLRLVSAARVLARRRLWPACVGKICLGGRDTLLIPYEFSLFHPPSSLCPFCSADITQSQSLPFIEVNFALQQEVSFIGSLL